MTYAIYVTVNRPNDIETDYRWNVYSLSNPSILTLIDDFFATGATSVVLTIAKRTTP